MIKIKYKKVTDGNNKQLIEITDINILPKSMLPSEYTDEKPYCYAQQDNQGYVVGLHLWINEIDYHYFHVDCHYDKDLFQNAIKWIKICGNKLHEINKERRAAKKQTGAAKLDKGKGKKKAREWDGTGIVKI